MTRRRPAAVPALALAACLAASGCSIFHKDAAKSLHDEFDALIAAAGTDQFTRATFGVSTKSDDPILTPAITFVQGTSVAAYRIGFDGKPESDVLGVTAAEVKASTAVASLKSIDLDGLLQQVQAKNCSPYGNVTATVMAGGSIHYAVGCAGQEEITVDGSPVEDVPTDPVAGIAYAQEIVAGLVDNPESAGYAAWDVDESGKATVSYYFTAPRGTSLTGAPCLAGITIAGAGGPTDLPVDMLCSQTEREELSLAPFLDPEVMTRIHQAIGSPTQGYRIQLQPNRLSDKPEFSVTSATMPNGEGLFDTDGNQLE